MFLSAIPGGRKFSAATLEGGLAEGEYGLAVQPEQGYERRE